MSDDSNSIVAAEIIAPKEEIPATIEAPTVEVEAAHPADHPVDVAIRAWIDAHVRNSPIAQASEAWNHLHAVLPALRALILRELGQ